MQQIFISYAQDQAHGQRLAEQAQQQLSSAGFTVFRDVGGVIPGTKWALEIERQLKASKLVVLVVSAKALLSDWVFAEFDMAKEHQIPIIPVFAEALSAPLWLRHLQRLDFSREADWQRLMQAVRSHINSFPEEHGAKKKIPKISSKNEHVVLELESQEESDDLLIEANVYIAYGLYHQAESELKKGIGFYPARLEYHHKLLECYFVANNREAFDRQAEQFAVMDGEGKENLWKGILEWGRKISPDNMLYWNGKIFVGTGTAAAVATHILEAVPAKAASAAPSTNLNLHLGSAPVAGEKGQDWLGDIDDALSFLDFPDEEIDLHEANISTKLDLARAYLDMGDIEGARSTLEEVMVEGSND
jgi:FimV-like protein